MQADSVPTPCRPRDSAGSAPAALELVLRGEHITLDALLKITGLAPSGGAAKVMIAARQVQVDGRDELRRGRKLRAGQQVTVGDLLVRVQAADGPAPADIDTPDTAAPANGTAATSRTIEP